MIVVVANFEHSIDRLADIGELVERSSKKFLLHNISNGRDQNDEPSMQQLGRIETAV